MTDENETQFNQNDMDILGEVIKFKSCSTQHNYLTIFKNFAFGTFLDNF